MGSGIAQVAAQSGYATILYELNQEVLDRAKTNLAQSLDKLVEKGKISIDSKTAILERIQFTGNLKSCIADVIIEAIVEKPQLKLDLFNQLIKLNSSDCIIASNTSSLSITEIANQLPLPERIIGMHFFNPAPVMKLVEIVKTRSTNSSVIESITKLALSMNKVPVLCQDSPGFIVNRVARPFYIEALRLAEKGVALHQIDELLENAGFRMGPFKLMDLIGNDINYAVSCSVYEQLGEPERLKPSYIQEVKVREKKLGKKTGEGYYKYS